MKKLLSLFGTIAIVGSGVSNVSACGGNKTNFNPNNFSTWGNKQKQILSSEMLNSVKDSFESKEITNFDFDSSYDQDSWFSRFGRYHDGSYFGDNLVQSVLQYFNENIHVEIIKKEDIINCKYSMYDILNIQITPGYNPETYIQTWKNGVLFKITAVPNPHPYSPKPLKTDMKGEVDFWVKGDITKN